MLLCIGLAWGCKSGPWPEDDAGASAVDGAADGAPSDGGADSAVGLDVLDHDSGSATDVGAPVPDAGGSDALPDTGSNQPPTLEWLEPEDNAIFQLGEPVTFKAQVADDQTAPADLGVAVTLSNAGAPSSFLPKVSDTGEIAFFSSALPAGKNTIVLRAFDGMGGEAQISRTVLINAAPGAPVVLIEPAHPKTGDDLVAKLVQPALDADSGVLPADKHSFTWLLDNVEVADLKGDKVAAYNTKRGQTWRVVVTASDGMATGVEATDFVTIANTGPTAAAISLSPKAPTVASTVHCELTKAAVDADGDKVSYLTRWTLNGLSLPQAGTATTLALASTQTGAWVPLVEVQQGDVLGCKVNATDGMSVGPLAEVTATLAAHDPCEGGLSGCGADQVCAAGKTAAAVCSCAPGWIGTAEACKDVDECFEGSAVCYGQSTCNNTVGGYGCPCDSGYSGDGTAKGGCVDVDECQTGAGTCDLAAECTNTVGSYACPCKPGFAGDGEVSGGCKDIDECEAGLAVCSLAADCTNTVGSYTCECLPGYSGDGKKCSDVDECKTGDFTCDEAAECLNVVGGYLCQCKAGWAGDGKSCVDVDECKIGAYTCDAHATCNNEDGTYQCKCDLGWAGDGKQCVDFDECKAGSATCSEQATCANTTGGYSCTCKAGYSGDGKTCADIDECAKGTAVCAADATCDNVAGSYACQCKPGFSGDGKVCEDVDECAKGTAKCHSAAICGNTSGGYTCICKPGWQGDGAVCTSK